MNLSNRIVEIDIGGHTYPMCLTLAVHDRICARYESQKGCIQHLDDLAGKFERDPETNTVKVIEPEKTAELITEYLWLLDELIAGGYAVQGSEVMPQLPDFRNVFCPGDVPYIQIKAMEAIRVGNIREVGTRDPKNGAGADGGQAPER